MGKSPESCGMRPSDVAVLTPAGAADASLAIAACRAGALGVLDLEYGAKRQDALRAVARLQQFTTAGYGVKLGPDGGELLQPLLATPGRLELILLAGGLHAELE